MKTYLIYLLTSILIFPGCKKDQIFRNIDGLSLYWDHIVHGAEGRRIIFEFYGTEKVETEYDLKFKYSINQQHIFIELVDIENKGRCPQFPSGSGMDNKCKPKGGFFIPEDLLQVGTYTFTLKTHNFKIDCEFSFKDAKYTLTIPPNEYFSSFKVEEYPMPPNILTGSIVYSGDENTASAMNFIDELNAVGFLNTIVPNYDKIPMSNADEFGKPKEKHWPPNKHSLGFICSMNNNFYKAYNIAEKYFNNSNINIYMSSSNGDQASLDKIQGVTVVFVD